jgi:hypothetical protein
MNKFLIRAISFSCVLGFASPAWTKPPQPVPHRAGPGAHPGKGPMGHKADQNHDGHVGPIERHAAIDKRNDVNTRKEAHWDTNNDGQVDKHEAKARVDSRWENRADKNNDGIVQAVEVSQQR